MVASLKKYAGTKAAFYVLEEAPDAPEEIMEAAAEEIGGPEGDREPD